MSLVVGFGVSLVFNIFSLFKWNAWKFFRAGKKILLIHPRENRRLTFDVATNHGGLAETKEGFYILNPDDIFIDKNSKVPCTFVYGKNAFSLNIKAGAIARRLKEEFKIEDPYELLEMLKNKKIDNIKILGESVPLHEIPNYFFANQRPDLIEAEIQNRTAVVIKQQSRKGFEILKYLIIFGVFLIIAVIAFNMLMIAKGNSSSVSLEQLKTLISQTQQTQRVIQNTTSSAVGTVIK